MIGLLSTNLLAWSAEVAVLVAAGAVVSYRWSHAGARLLFWQGILAMMLLLPFLVPFRAQPLEAIPNDAIAQVTSTTAIIGIHPGSVHLWSLDSLLWLLATGATLRLIWIAAGLIRLRRLRLNAAPMQDAPRFPFDRNPVRWFVSDRVAGPVTYGWLRPSILIPRRVLSLPDAPRDAILCHELLHIERRDWLFVLFEELLRAALWFHPAVWFALAKIQLAREEAVDQEVVRRTLDRDAYVDALLEVAAQQIEPDVAPAPLFLKKRQLAARVTAVTQEVHSSRSQILLRSVGACIAAAAAATLAVWLFPLQSEAQYSPDDEGISVDAGGTLLHRGPLRYPAGTRTGGLVILDATLNTRGEVSDAHVVSGPEQFRREALSNVLGWHYSTERGASPGARIAIQFQRALPDPPAPPPGVNRTGRLRNVEGRSGVVGGIRFTPGLSPDLKLRIESLLPRIGDPIGIPPSPESAARIRAALREVDEHLNVNYRAGSDGNVTIDVGVPPAQPLTAPPPPPPPPPPPVAEPPQNPRLRIGGDLQAANLIEKITPLYPPLAKQARIQGTVSLRAVIGKDGHILDLDALSGHPLLVEAAVAAVKQWVYRPTLLNGDPTEVVTQIDVHFTLTQ